MPTGVPLTALTVLLNSQNVTGAFQPEASGNSLLGLVQGMPLGRNILIAEVLGPRNQIVLSARLTLTNYPITGPIFSGPQEQPFYCMTQLFTLPASTQTLGQAVDANCSIETRVDYVYQTTGGTFGRCRARQAILQILLRRQPAKGRRFLILCGSRPERSTAASTKRRCCTIRPKRRRRPLQSSGRMEPPPGLYHGRRLCRRLVHSRRKPWQRRDP